MKASRLTTKYLRTKSVTKNSEGVTTDVWATAVACKCEVWPSAISEKIDVEGARAEGTMHMRIVGAYAIEHENNHERYNFGTWSIREGDGVCLYVASTETPDYYIKSITPYRPLLLTLERK